jgi:uncharacterized protein (DUF2141 family)
MSNSDENMRSHESFDSNAAGCGKAAIAVFLSVACAILPTAAAHADTGQLVVVATGFKGESGHAVAKLFLHGENVLKRGSQEIKSDIRGDRATMAFTNLPAGDYAVVVFHDANDNGVIDHNLFGIPKEALGFSNTFKMSMASGLPAFEKLRFSHGDAAQLITIRVELP